MQLVPAVTSAEMAAVDQAMVEDYGIDLIQMMEKRRAGPRGAGT